MLKQDLRAEQDEDHAAGELGLALVAQAEHVAEPDAGRGKDEGDRADERHGGHDTRAGQERERDADGERVDARGDGQQEHGLECKRAVELVLIFGQRLADHVAADDAQQYERDPVIDGGDKLLKLRAEQIAQQRHERLKAAEPRACDAAFLPRYALQRQPLADGDGKRVHRQADCQHDQFPKPHIFTSLFPQIPYTIKERTGKCKKNQHPGYRKTGVRMLRTPAGSFASAGFDEDDVAHQVHFLEFAGDDLADPHQVGQRDVLAVGGHVTHARADKVLFAVLDLICIRKTHGRSLLFYPLCLFGKLEGFFELVVAVVKCMQCLSQRRGRFGLALILQRVADVVQLVSVMAVVVEHIVQQRQHFLGAHRFVAGVLVAVRVAVMCMIVIVFMFVHGKHSFLSGAGPPCGKIILL